MDLIQGRIERSPSRSNYVRVVGTVTYDEPAFPSEEYWFEFPERFTDALNTSGDPWLACLLPLAVTLGEPLRIAMPVDRDLLENTVQLQEIWKCWYPNLHVVPVIAEVAEPPKGPPPVRTAAFFSGGVDSFYTALKHSGEIASSRHGRLVEDLLCVWGFDVPLTKPIVFERMRSSLSRAAEELGLQLVDIATNLRQTRWKETNWAHLSHGAAMGAIAQAASRVYGTVLVPSTDSYNQLYAWGSHILTDRLFSTTRTAVIHDGAEASRFQKIEVLGRSNPALAALRVCWRSESDENCCKCQKCYRTMLALELLGILNRCTSFRGAKVDLDLVRRIYIEWDLVGDYRELKDRATETGRNDLANAIGYAFWRSHGVSACLKAVEALQGIPSASVLARGFSWLAHSRTLM